MNMFEETTEYESRIQQLALIVSRFKSEDYNVSFDISSNIACSLYVLKENQGVILNHTIDKETTSDKFNDIVQLLILLQRLSPIED